MTDLRKAARLVVLVLALSAVALSAAGEGEAGDDGFRITAGDNFSLDMHFFAEIDATRQRDEVRYSGELYRWLETSPNHLLLPQEQGFDIRRGRAIFEGKALAPWLGFRLEAEVTGESLDSELLDAYATLRAGERWQFTVGQFRAPFGLFQLTRRWRQLMPELSPATEHISPGRDVGVGARFDSASNRLHLTAAIQNGAGRNRPDNDTDQQFALRLELTGPDGFSYDTPIYRRPSAGEEVTVGLSLITGSTGDVDTRTGGLCLVAAGRNCGDSVSRDGAELFFGYRAQQLTLLASWQKWRHDNGRLRNRGPLPDYSVGAAVPASSVELFRDDLDVDVLQFELGGFLSPRWQVVARWSETNQPDYRLIDPVSSGLGPQALTDTGGSDSPVSADRPPYVDLLERLRQWGGGVNWMINDQNLKLQVGWMQTELLSQSRDTYVAYVPDVGWRGFDGSMSPILPDDHLARKGKLFTRKPVLYFVLSWYN